MLVEFKFALTRPSFVRNVVSLFCSSRTSERASERGSKQIQRVSKCTTSKDESREGGKAMQKR